MMLRQYQLRNGGSYKTCWLDSLELRKGMYVRLRGDDRWWKVTEAYNISIDDKSLALNKGYKDKDINIESAVKGVFIGSR